MNNLMHETPSDAQISVTMLKIEKKLGLTEERNED